MRELASVPPGARLARSPSPQWVPQAQEGPSRHSLQTEPAGAAAGESRLARGLGVGKRTHQGPAQEREADGTIPRPLHVFATPPGTAKEESTAPALGSCFSAPASRKTWSANDRLLPRPAKAAPDTQKHGPGGIAPAVPPAGYRPARALQPPGPGAEPPSGRAAWGAFQPGPRPHAGWELGLKWASAFGTAGASSELSSYTLSPFKVLKLSLWFR